MSLQPPQCICQNTADFFKNKLQAGKVVYLIMKSLFFGKANLAILSLTHGMDALMIKMVTYRLKKGLWEIKKNVK